MSDFNQWFLSLGEKRQRVLKDEKWTLAETAFEAGKQQVNAELLEALQDSVQWIKKLEDWSGVGDPDLEKYETAIAKATGQGQ